MSTILGDLLLRIRGDASGGKAALGETRGGIREMITPANVLRGAMAGLSAGIAFGAKTTQGLNQLMARMQAETGASKEELEGMRDTIQRTFKTNEDSYEALTGTVTALRTQMGMSAEEIDRDMQSYLDFAKVTGQDNVAAVENLDDVLDAWQMDAKDASGIMDMLVVSHQKYGGSVQQNLGQLSRLAPAAQALGMDLSQTNGLLNLFASTGLDASQAQMALTYAVRQFESPEQFKTALADLSAMEDPTLRAQRAVEIFGSRAGVALANSFGPGKEGLDAFAVSVTEAEGATTKASAAWDDTFNVKFALWRKRISGTVQEISEKFGPALMTSASLLTATTAVMPGMIGGLSILGKGLGAVAGIARTSVIPSLISMALALGPVGLIIGGLILVVGALALAWKTNFLGIRDLGEKVLGWLTERIAQFRDWFQENWQKVIQVLLLLTGPLGLLVTLIWRNFDQIKDTISGFVDFVSRTLGNLPEIVGRILSSMVDRVRSGVSRAREWLGRLNPFHRESPSLVEQFEAGMDRISRRAAELRLEVPAARDMVGGGPGLAAAGAGVNIYITGNTLMNEHDADRLGDLLVRRLKAEGIRP